MGNSMEDSRHVHDGKIVRNVSQCVLVGGGLQTTKSFYYHVPTALATQRDRK